MTDKLIITCNCGDTDSFAEDAFRILFPSEPVPPVRHIETAISDIALTFPSRQELEAMQKTDQKFAYYFDASTSEIWDLLKGVRIG